jgi:hypothetical protein
VERPFDPDEMPLTSELSQEERAMFDELAARPYDGAASSDELPVAHPGTSLLRGRPFRLRGFGTFGKGGSKGGDTGGSKGGDTGGSKGGHTRSDRDGGAG